MTELDGHLLRARALWPIWVENGVTPGTLLAVDFHFYAAKPGSVEALEQVLSEAGFLVKKAKKRTFLIFQGISIEATESRCWTLVAIEERVRELYDLANRTGVMFDGFGAEMP